MFALSVASEAAVEIAWLLAVFAFEVASLAAAAIAADCAASAFVVASPEAVEIAAAGLYLALCPKGGTTKYRLGVNEKEIPTATLSKKVEGVVCL